MTSRSSCEVSALATSSVVVPILMNSEQPLGISAAAAAPIAFFSGSDEAARFVGEVLHTRGNDGAAMNPRQRPVIAQIIQILANGCAETSKRRARSSTITRPKARAIFRISFWR